MGIEPVRMSAGNWKALMPEIQSVCSELAIETLPNWSKSGKMCVLLINDLDAGAGRVDKSTQYTVNTQLVNGTLMNIADNPTDVQLPGSWNSAY